MTEGHEAEDGSKRWGERLRWRQALAKEEYRQTRIDKMARAIVDLGWERLTSSEESALQKYSDLRKAVMDRVRQLQRQDAIRREKAHRAADAKKILARKRPTVSIEEDKGLKFRRQNRGPEIGAILVVDDIKADLDKLCGFLADTQMPIHRATNVADALRILRRQPIVMLVTDIVLPMYRLAREEYVEWVQQATTQHRLLMHGITMEQVRVTKTTEVKRETTDYSQFAGFKLLDEARKILPWLPVIVVSRYLDIDMARRAIGSQVQDVLSKQAHLSSQVELLRSVRRNMIPIQQRFARLGRGQLLDFLDGASEETVTLNVLVPLLHKLGYRGLRYTHGTNECGLDLVFYDLDRLGIRRYMGAQVKATKIHKSVGGPASAAILAILQQVQQAFLSTLYMLPERTELELDRIFVISSKSFTKPARDYIRKALMGEVYAQHMEFWDAETIVDLWGMRRQRK